MLNFNVFNLLNQIISLIVVSIKFLSIYSRKAKSLEKQNAEIIKILAEIKEKICLTITKSVVVFGKTGLQGPRYCPGRD